MSFDSAVSCLKRLFAKPSSLIGLSAIALVSLPLAAQGPDQSLAARTMGLKTAPVTVYEMADFQCPICRDFALKDFPVIQKDYINTGKVKWVYINFPLSSIHANAVAAAEFAVCASKQGKFWPTHEMLYTTHDEWEKLKDPTPYFESKIAALAIDRAAMVGCLKSGQAEAIVRDDATGSERSGAHSTPSFYIEGGMIEGLWPLSVFRHVLDSVYAAKSTKSVKG